MNFWSTLSTVWRGLLANKLRSFLTLLGIIFGVATVITMMGVTEGFRKNFVQQVTDLGTRNIMVRYDMSKRRASKTSLLTMDDLHFVLSRNPYLDRAVPFIGSGAKIKTGEQEKEEDIQLTGTTQDIGEIMSLNLERGRMFDAEEVKTRANVCVLGYEPKTKLFSGKNPVGREILIRNTLQRLRCTVIGYFAEKSGFSGREVNDSIILPYTTLQFKLLGARDFRTFWAEAKDYSLVEAANEKIKELLKHRGLPIETWNPKQVLEFQRDMFRKITLFGLVISGISLLIGGIGIMNIMLVSVMERIREIGLRRAVGARQRDIMAQFLLESTFVGGLGGLLGVPLGVSGSLIFTKLLKLNQAVSFPSIFIALFFAASVSILFGFYPAKRAALLDPVEALRYE